MEPDKSVSSTPIGQESRDNELCGSQTVTHDDLIDVQLNSGKVSYVSNFDGDKMHQWKLTSLACGPDCLQHADIPDGVMHLRYFYCHRIEMVSQRDGEIIEPIRCVLIDDNLKAYGFVSDYIAREIDQICQIFGRGPWVPALPIRVRKFQTRKGNQCYSIGPV